uniref:AlbA family DNA-binding domain-containing protein n=1 Tax=Trichocoleus desertorum TaxID=1481672 RepID=UPI0025B40A9A|nr:ATP-binding protein [Trichocoleus desertorum]
MVFGNKPLDEINENDLQALVTDQVAEKKTIDYKKELHGGSDKDRKEFFYDVSSFANAAGGYLVFGVEESEGIPTNVCGLEIDDLDATLLRPQGVTRRLEQGLEAGSSV